MELKDAQYKKMTEQPVSRLILSLAVPTIISMMVTAVYNTADTYFVSQLGTSASGAVGIVMSLMGIIQSSGFLIGMGAGSWMSRLLGEKKESFASEVAGERILFCACDRSAYRSVRTPVSGSADHAAWGNRDDPSVRGGVCAVYLVRCALPHYFSDA